LIGSIIGVGVANALLHGRSGTSGVDWSKAKEVGEALLLSPLFGFALAAVLLLLLKSIVRIPALYAEPKGDQPPPCGSAASSSSPAHWSASSMAPMTDKRAWG
jgi:PiT family inorganic phosphate transporter